MLNKGNTGTVFSAFSAVQLALEGGEIVALDD